MEQFPSANNQYFGAMIVNCCLLSSILLSTPQTLTALQLAFDFWFLAKKPVFENDKITKA